jgi:hypothetical protein
MYSDMAKCPDKISFLGNPKGIVSAEVLWHKYDILICGIRDN